MAKIYTGRDGALRINNKALAKVSSFSFQAELETLETTTLGDSIRSYTPGIAGYSGSASLMYYKDGSDTFNTTEFLKALVKTGTAGVGSSDTVELALRWIDGDDTNEIKLDAYITSAQMGAATAEITRAEVSFVGTGALKTVDIS